MDDFWGGPKPISARNQHPAVRPMGDVVVSFLVSFLVSFSS